MKKLSVNVDHVATVRQARRGVEPDPVLAASIAELAGCDGIIVHLREDRRHIQDRDLKLLRQTVKTKLNLEMAAVSEMVEIARQVRPDCATMVPERREELTTEGGLNVVGQEEELREAVQQLRASAIQVSLFVDPEPEQIKASSRVGGECVEIHTGAYAEAKSPGEADEQLDRIVKAITVASSLGLEIRAGHGLDYHNIKSLLPIPEIEEFSIGFSIMARAIVVGLERAVREMVELLAKG